MNYSTTSLDGKPSLSYQDSHQSKTFRGNEIRTVECDLGTLVSVTLQMTVDVGSTTFTLLIPRIQTTPGHSVAVHTYGVTTLHSMPFAIHILPGQKDTYHTVALQGTAQLVAF